MRRETRRAKRDPGEARLRAKRDRPRAKRDPGETRPGRNETRGRDETRAKRAGRKEPGEKRLGRNESVPCKSGVFVWQARAGIELLLLDL